MALYGASPQQLTTAAGYCENTVQYIEGMRKRVEAIKAGLAWQGGAYKKFSEAMVQWDMDFAAVNKILDGIKQKLIDNAGGYRNVAGENEGIVGGFYAAGAGANNIDLLINASER
ncbi:WXG domain conatining protein [Nonomuraea coxensis DSM 45129]|uniref:WXG domain conatining protein n=1 Tax=Nonomuraea coxensis DSM 45129 TaxID=1122611 RepID=A0ABX8TTQ1_9ACTN|nr:WXG100 family type VII secretion target [Nonomuraea coxensis]QYC38717.1 WXG domain conatining protein [Nonomuraea coxensis DSM 45129]